MASDVENSCKFIDLGQDVGQFDGVFPEILAVVLVFQAYVVLHRLRQLDGAGIERCFAALWRCNHDLCLVFEDHIRMDEFRLSNDIQSVPFALGRRIRTKYQPVSLPFGNFC